MKNNLEERLKDIAKRGFTKTVPAIKYPNVQRQAVILTDYETFKKIVNGTLEIENTKNTPKEFVVNNNK